MPYRYGPEDDDVPDVPAGAPVPLDDQAPRLQPRDLAGDYAHAPQPIMPGNVSPWDDLIRQYAPDDLRDNPHFISTVAAGALNESHWDPLAVQPGGGGRGLWQFDIGQGAKGEGLSDEQLFDPAFQAERILPDYAEAYRRYAAQGLTGADLAGRAYAWAERPYGWDDPRSQARRNYAANYQRLMVAGPASAPTPGFEP